MVQSFSRLSSSMSAVFGAYGSSTSQAGRAPVKGPGAAGPKGTGRGTIKGTARGGGNMPGRGAGRGTGKRPVKGLGRTNSSGVNTPLINPQGKPNNSGPVDNKPADVKRKRQKQKKTGKYSGMVSRSSLAKALSCILFLFTNPANITLAHTCQTRAQVVRGLLLSNSSHSSAEVRVASECISSDGIIVNHSIDGALSLKQFSPVSLRIMNVFNFFAVLIGRNKRVAQPV